MADPNVYPQQIGVNPQQVAPEPLALTPEETAEVQALYDTLKPQATQEARDYVLARTPAKYQVDMAALIEADWPAPPVMDEAMARSRAEDLKSASRPAQPPA